MILCCDAKEGIGFENKLPWKIPEEMKLFRDKTIGNKNNCVIMGRATFESIPEKHRPLKDRYHYVLSKQGDINYGDHPNVQVIQSFDILLETIASTTFDEYWIIGGKSIYEAFLVDTMIQHVDEIHISILNNRYNCDTFLPVMTHIKELNAKNPILPPFQTMQKTNYTDFTHYIICQNMDYL